MLRSLKELKGYRLGTKDGEIGHIEDFYFDDESWHVRFLVADTGTWLPGKKIVIASAGFFGQPDSEKNTFPVVFYTPEMMKKECSDAETVQTVSEQKKEELSRYYHWQEWSSEHPGVPPIVGVMSEITEAIDRIQEINKTHLRGMNEVLGYHIQTEDAELGHVSDFIIDDNDWGIKFIVAATKNWLPGKEVLLIPLWIDKIRWAEKKVFVNLTEEQLKNSPEYDPAAAIGGDQQKTLFDYFVRDEGGIENNGV